MMNKKLKKQLIAAWEAVKNPDFYESAEQIRNICLKIDNPAIHDDLCTIAGHAFIMCYCYEKMKND